MNCDASCCRFAPMTRNEWKRIVLKYGPPKRDATLITFEDRTEVMIVRDRITGRCGYLDDANRCEVYADRPRICRLYGTDPRAPCGHCQPDRAACAAKARDFIATVKNQKGVYRGKD